MVGVAVLGFGVVGSGVVEVIEENREVLARRAGQTFAVKYICDVRDFPQSPYHDLFVKDFSVVLNDPSVSIVVETIGGQGAAFALTKQALAAGKSVVTSNKELVSARGVELFSLAAAHGVEYLYEASVGGGIPIIRPLQHCLAANDLLEVSGILNGTTNYILTQMEQTGTSFADALMQAQALGYAEQNPEADIAGKDTCRKMSILASLALGARVAPEEIPTSGIEHVAAADLALAKALFCRVKLVGRAVKHNGVYYVGVAPCFVSEESPLFAVSDVFNAVIVKGSASGELMFRGRGAGKLPTASAVVADVIDAARQSSPRAWFSWGERTADVGVADVRDLPHTYALRFATEADAAQAAGLLTGTGHLAAGQRTVGQIPANRGTNGPGLVPGQAALVTKSFSAKGLADALASAGVVPQAAYVMI